jgi:hypothetical protein
MSGLTVIRIVAGFSKMVPGRGRVGWGLRIGCLIVLHPEDALYSPYDAANRTSHHRTDRAGTPVTFIYAIPNAAGYSLRLGGERNRERSNKSACNQDLSLHKLIPLFNVERLSARR